MNFTCLVLPRLFSCCCMIGPRRVRPHQGSACQRGGDTQEDQQAEGRQQTVRVAMQCDAISWSFGCSMSRYLLLRRVCCCCTRLFLLLTFRVRAADCRGEQPLKLKWNCNCLLDRFVERAPPQACQVGEEKKFMESFFSIRSTPPLLQNPVSFFSPLSLPLPSPPLSPPPPPPAKSHEGSSPTKSPR